ncbi:bifunctional 5,10-methylenetetrahydrofolate dehydrogenase/5,10-methenyltetrahydrofolate cyclohydrolase [Gordonia terrae]
MSAQIIDGRKCARALTEKVIADVAALVSEQVQIGLATVVVGDNYGARAYERKLRRLAEELGVPYYGHTLDDTLGQDELLDLITALNADPTVSGILILRPLPDHIDEATVFRSINPSKDIESVHPENAGLLALGVPRFVPSTAASVFHLLDSYLDSVGENRADFYHRSLIVVVGRSNNVGKPAISLGYARQATVESVDEWADKTTGIGRHTRWADVLVVAAGKAGLIKAEHVSENAIVIDVGINPSTSEDGKVRMVGDVDFDSVAPRVRAITPVPGGVGPVTDIWLLHNTVLAARLLAGHDVDGRADLITDNSNPLQEAS